MSKNVVYVWSQTPKEWFACIRPVHSRQAADTVRVEQLPFAGVKRSLPGTKFFYQIALSATSLALDVQALRKECPGIPASGDSRSGILVLDRDTVVASYILPGEFTTNPRRIAVHPNYRGKGLAKTMLSQWMREVPSVIKVSAQPINLGAIKTFMSAIKATVLWAKAAGKSVPSNVQAAWDSGEQEAAILAELTKIEQASGSPSKRRVIFGPSR